MKRNLPPAFRPRRGSRSGAASIIVVFMIMVLFVFGILSLTMGVANLRLSRKSLTFNAEYYSLEKRAEEALFQLDALLLDAERQARYAAGTTTGLDNPSAAAYLDTFQRYFYYYACVELRKMPENLVSSAELDADRYLNTRENLADLALPLIYLDVTEDETKYILVGIQAVCPAYDIQWVNGVVSGVRADHAQARYEIIEWREWQRPFDYSQPVEFWDGSLDTP